jgi:predicted NUDIX family NTP pyrophosphohydrolase
MEWPPRSGKIKEFPEVDQGTFFKTDEAKVKINPAQSTFLDRLMESLGA